MNGKERIFFVIVSLAISPVLAELARRAGWVHSIWLAISGFAVGTVLFQTLGFIVDRLRAKRGRP